MFLSRRRRDRALRVELGLTMNHSGIDVHGRRLVRAELRGKIFSNAVFDDADLTEADLRGADLSHASMKRTFLTGARLDGADLTGAALDGAYLIGAELPGSILEGTTFSDAIWDQATRWPQGFRPPRGDVGLMRGHHNDSGGAQAT
jgi:uncharacterized protein YjbI with pentapeptide repeats